MTPTRALSTPPIITPRPPGQVSLPLSSAQQRLWLMNQIDPADTAYHMYLTWRIRGPLDAGLLAGALSGPAARCCGPRLSGWPPTITCSA